MKDEVRSNNTDVGDNPQVRVKEKTKGWSGEER
jgi:hypothetical protein